MVVQLELVAKLFVDVDCNVNIENPDEDVDLSAEAWLFWLFVIVLFDEITNGLVIDGVWFSNVGSS